MQIVHQATHGTAPSPYGGGAVPVPQKPGKLRRLPFVMDATGFGKSSIYAGVKAGTFPAPVRLSARAVGWREEDIDKWIGERVSTGGQ